MRKSFAGFSVLFVLALALSVVAFPAAVFAAGEITGTVFFDANGNGVRDTGEAAISGVTVGLSGGQSAWATTDGAGAYRFAGLAAGAYTVTETDLSWHISTTVNVRSVAVGSTMVGGVDFGDVTPSSVSGYVFRDVNNDGIMGFTESPLPGSLVQLFQDSDGDGQVDAGEPLLGEKVADSQGWYGFSNLLPGQRVLRVIPPSGQGDPAQLPLALVGTEDGTTLEGVNIGVLPATAGASVSGVVWNDLDGDEQIDSDPAEPGLGNVTLYLTVDLNGNRQVDVGESPLASTATDPAGSYAFNNLGAGAYVLQVDALTVPAGWTPSTGASVQAFTLAASEDLTVHLGYYDPLVVAPLRVAEWKKELKQAGKPRYSAQEVSSFIAAAQEASLVFPELDGLEHALTGPAPTAEAKARKQHAALWLNRTSNRLLQQTPVNLPDLTTATTVGQAMAEIEGLLVPPAMQTKETYKRAEKIAEALNSGKGVGYGAASTSVVARATYKGKDVTSALKPAGGTVDVYRKDGMVDLIRWSPGALDPATNIFRPQMRVKVQAFYEGGVLEVMQKLSNGSYASLGTLVPTVWNKDVKATYTVDVWRVATLSELVSTQFSLVVRDPDNDGGKEEHVKIDSAELIFDY